MERFSGKRLTLQESKTPVVVNEVPGGLTINESLALEVINSMPISYQDARTLFTTYIFLDQGVFRSKDLLGFSIDQTIAARDRTRTKKPYQNLWEDFDFIFKFQSQKPQIKKRIGENHPDFDEIFKLKQHDSTNQQIAESLGITIKHVDNLTRALVFLRYLPGNPSAVKRSEDQNYFLHKIIMLRAQGLGNQQIAEKMEVALGKVEEAARFLVWTGIVDPISKTQGLLRRHNPVDYEDQVRRFLLEVDNSTLVNIRKLHRRSNMPIGYDKFLRIFHQIEHENGLVPRYWRRPRKVA